MVDLQKGGNAAIVGPIVSLTLHTRLAPGEIDLCALLVDPARRTRSDQDFVFFNQDSSGCGSTRIVSASEIEVDLLRVPSGVDAIVIAAALGDAVHGHIAGHGGGWITLQDGATAIRHTLAGLTIERCVIVAELYRRASGWKVRAVSQGYDGLPGLIGDFGVETVDPPQPQLQPGSSVPPPSPRQPEAVPPQVKEIIDRVRAGTIARRAEAPLSPPQPAWGSPAQRRPATVTQYRAQRRATAEQLTAELQQQNYQLETVLQTLPHRDLGVRTLLELVDASVPDPASPRRRLFARRKTPQQSSGRPSALLGPALHRLLDIGSRVTNRDAVEAWLWLALYAMDMQPSCGHAEGLSLHSAERKIVLDVRLPDRGLVPAYSKVRYKTATDYFEHVPAPIKDRARLTGILYSASLLAHAHALGAAVWTIGLPDDILVVVNGWEWARDPATGRTESVCRGTLATSARELGTIDLRGVDPPMCVRGLSGRVNEAGRVTPRATRAQSTADQRHLDLATIDPFEFEALVTELAEAMGYVAYQTPRSGDHGVDVFVESTDTLASGRIVISAKRFNGTVGPDHVRALDSVVRDQGAIKGILITTSRFGPESYRVVQDKPLQLVDGQELRQWLTSYLGVADT